MIVILVVFGGLCRLRIEPLLEHTDSQAGLSHAITVLLPLHLELPFYDNFLFSHDLKDSRPRLLVCLTVLFLFSSVIEVRIESIDDFLEFIRQLGDCCGFPDLVHLLFQGTACLLENLSKDILMADKSVQNLRGPLITGAITWRCQSNEFVSRDVSRSSHTRNLQTIKICDLHTDVDVRSVSGVCRDCQSANQAVSR